MAMTDPIADMLTRIRNANSVYHDKVDIPGSKIKTAIAEVLKQEGYIKDYTFTQDNKQGILTVFLNVLDAEREKVYIMQKGEFKMAIAAKWQIKQKNQMNKDVNESMGAVNATSYFSSDTAIKNAFVDEVNVASRAISALTTNTYQDAAITFSISINDEISERE